MKVYIAAASAEIARAERVAAKLTSAGIEVTSSWMANVRKVGAANPRDASREQRRAWANGCLAEVAKSDVVLLLMPPIGTETIGAYWEAGFALGDISQTGLDRRIVISGDTKRSVFSALGEEYETDDEAIQAIIGG